MGIFTLYFHFLNEKLPEKKFFELLYRVVVGGVLPQKHLPKVTLVVRNLIISRPALEEYTSQLTWPTS